VKPNPPCNWIASLVTRLDISLQVILATAAIKGSANGLQLRRRTLGPRVRNSCEPLNGNYCFARPAAAVAMYFE
jgi:hypothetical protein